MDKTRSINNAIWDNYYRAYQKESDMPGVKYPNEHLVRFINAISKKNNRKDKKILELGFGTIANMLMMQNYGYQVLGLEVSSDAVRRAQNIINAKNLENKLKVSVFTGNIIPAKNESFDIIVGLQCVYYNTDQKLFAKECHRVLKPEGRTFLSFFSQNHGYMKYIQGRAGSIVKFNDDHPNPRLKGLRLFLFKSRKQFKDIYGKYFNVEIGLDEFDLYPIFMSWYYLIGQKKPCTEFISSLISFYSPPGISVNKEKCDTKISNIEVNNAQLWEEKYNSLYKSELVPGNKYPNEHFIRFLTTRERGPLNKFYTNIGREDRIKSRGMKTLELMPLNITNLLIASEMGYIAYGLSSSDIVIEKTKEAAGKIGKENTIFVNKLEKCYFPYEESKFHFILSEKAGSYIPDQEKLIKETARVIKKDGEIFIGYLSPRHEYIRWTKELGGGYYKITTMHPDPTMHEMIIYIRAKEALKNLWGRFFNVEIKSVEYDLHRYFSSFYFVKASRK